MENMKNILVISTFLLVHIGFTACHNSKTDQTTPEKKGTISNGLPAQIDFSTVEVDLGELVAGEIIEYKFNFKNTGNEPLIIQRIDVSCGCTTTSFTKEPVKSGESGSINVVFDSTGFRGLQIKTVTVHSTAENSPTELTLAALVKKEN